MYIYKSFGNVECIFARNTRQGHRFNFRVDNYQSGKYKSSLCFKGTILWDCLPDNVINLLTLLEFKKEVKSRFQPFSEELLYFSVTAMLA